jgi:hypothetical protein
MRLLISTLLVAGFAVSSALADGMSQADVAAAKGGHPVAQARDGKHDVGVPKNQSSVVVTIERGVRVWRPIVEAPDYGDGYEVVAPRVAGAEPQYYGNGYYNGGGYGGYYGGGVIGGGLGNGAGYGQNYRGSERNGAGVGRPNFANYQGGRKADQIVVRDPRQYRGDRHMPQVHRHGEAPRMSPRDDGGRNMGPGPQMARPHMANKHMARQHVAQRPVHMARPHVPMAGPRMMMGGPKMHARPMARPMMKRMGGGRRH